MKNNKAPGKDGISIEMLKAGGNTLIKVLHSLRNKIMKEKKIPSNWDEAITLLLYNVSGHKPELRNYRPETLVNTMYKLMTKILTKRLTIKFD